MLHRTRTGQPMPAWTDDALSALVRYTWPGNVRELANIIERLSILYPGRHVTETDVGAVLPMERTTQAASRTPLPDASSLDQPLSDPPGQVESGRVDVDEREGTSVKTLDSKDVRDDLARKDRTSGSHQRHLRHRAEF
jgi:DNA-binding NtrC family response regulator